MPRTVSTFFNMRLLAAFLIWSAVAYPSVCAAGLPAQGEVSIGVVFTGDLPRYHRAYEEFLSQLADDAELFSRLKIYRQVPNPDPFSWENSARRAVASGIDLFVTFGAPATLAARKVAPDIPLIYGDVYGPKQLDSDTTPRLLTENVSGVTSRVPIATLVRSFAQLLPLKKMGVIFNSQEMGSLLQVSELQSQALSQGFTLQLRDIQAGEQLEKALEELLSLGANVLYLSESAVVGSQADTLFEWCRRHQLPVISHVPGGGEQGAILSHEVSPEEQGRLMARCLILKLDPRQPDCPRVVTPREIDFCINLQIAKSYGLSVPFRTLTLATKVIH